MKKKRLLCWNKGEEEAVAGWQQQLAVGDRRRVSDWRMTVKVINIYIYLYRPNFNFRLECPLFAGAAGIVQYCPVFRTWPGYFPKCSDCCEFFCTWVLEVFIDFWLSDLIGLGLGFSQVGSTSKMGQLSPHPDISKKLRCIRFHLMDQLASGGYINPNMKAFI